MKFIFLLALLALTTVANDQQQEILTDTLDEDTPTGPSQEYTADDQQKQQAAITYFQQALQIFKEELQSSGLKTFGTKKQLNKLQKLLEETNIWLQNHRSTAEVQDLDKRFSALLEIHSPIANRSLEYKDRDNTYENVTQALDQIYNTTTSLLQSHPNLFNQAQNLLEKINATKQWIKAHYLRQKERKLNQNIIFYNHQMLTKVDQIGSLYQAINKIVNIHVEDQNTNIQEVNHKQQKHTEQSPTQPLPNDDL